MSVTALYSMHGTLHHAIKTIEDTGQTRSVFPRNGVVNPRQDDFVQYFGTWAGSVNHICEESHSKQKKVNSVCLHYF